MALSAPVAASRTAPSYEMLLESIDCTPLPEPEDCIISYRSSPDGSLTMGTDPISGQVVLIVQNAEQRWEIALPPKIACFATSETRDSLADAKLVATRAFQSYWASMEK